MLLATAAVDAQPEPATAAPNDKAAASIVFKEAKQQFQSGQHADALAGFERSYELFSSPNSLLMIAKCQRELGRHVQAYETARRSIAEATEAAVKNEKYNQTREAAQKTHDELRALLVVVDVQILGDATGGTLMVAGREIPPESWDEPIVAEAGAIAIELTHQGSVASKQVDGAAGASLEVTLNVPTATTAATDDAGDMPLLVPAIVAGGVGVAGFALFGIFGALNEATFSDLQERCNDGACPADASSDIESGQAYQTTANIGLIVGAIGLATGAGLVIADLVGSDDDADADQTGFSQPQLRLWPGGVLVEGRF